MTTQVAQKDEAKAPEPSMRRIVVRKTGAIRPTAACGCYHPQLV